MKVPVQMGVSVRPCIKSMAICPKLRQEYQEYLNTHCQFFVCNEFPEIITLNIMEMKRDDVRFFRYYFTGKFDRGYLVYNREMKPMPSLD